LLLRAVPVLLRPLRGALLAPFDLPVPFGLLATFDPLAPLDPLRRAAVLLPLLLLRCVARVVLAFVALVRGMILINPDVWGYDFGCPIAQATQ